MGSYDRFQNIDLKTICARNVYTPARFNSIWREESAIQAETASKLAEAAYCLVRSGDDIGLSDQIIGQIEAIITEYGKYNPVQARYELGSLVYTTGGLIKKEREPVTIQLLGSPFSPFDCDEPDFDTIYKDRGIFTITKWQLRFYNGLRVKSMYKHAKLLRQAEKQEMPHLGPNSLLCFTLDYTCAGGVGFAFPHAQLGPLLTEKGISILHEYYKNSTGIPWVEDPLTVKAGEKFVMRDSNAPLMAAAEIAPCQVEVNAGTLNTLGDTIRGLFEKISTQERFARALVTEYLLAETVTDPFARTSLIKIGVLKDGYHPSDELLEKYPPFWDIIPKKGGNTNGK